VYPSVVTLGAVSDVEEALSIIEEEAVIRLYHGVAVVKAGKTAKSIATW